MKLANRKQFIRTILFQAFFLCLSVMGVLLGIVPLAVFAGLLCWAPFAWLWATEGTIPRKDVPAATVRWVLESELPAIPPPSDPEREADKRLNAEERTRRERGYTPERRLPGESEPGVQGPRPSVPRRRGVHATPSTAQYLACKRGDHMYVDSQRECVYCGGGYDHVTPPKTLTVGEAFDVAKQLPSLSTAELKALHAQNRAAVLELQKQIAAVEAMKASMAPIYGPDSDPELDKPSRPV